jgi:hypothetical protein
MLKRSVAALMVLAVVTLSVPPPAKAEISDCCLLAFEIFIGISELNSQTTEFLTFAGGPPARGAQLLKALAKAQENLTLGVDQNGTCDSTKAKQKFILARGWLLNYVQVLLQYGPIASDLIDQANAVVAALDLLIAGICVVPDGVE